MTGLTKKASAVLIRLLLLGVAGGVLSACHTIAGAGEDLSAAGHAVTRKAEQASGNR